MQASHCLTAIGFAALVTVPALAGPPAGSFALGLSRAERQALLSGEVVSRPMRVDTETGSYRGGLSYSLVHAQAATVLTALSNVQTLPQALPSTQSARLIDVRGSLSRVELVHSGGATYTVFIERSADRSGLRFWLDSSRPHDIGDLFGFFRVEPFGAGQSLVTVAALLDLGSGLTSLLFSDAVQRTVLRTPGQIRRYVEPRALASLDVPGWVVGF